MAGIRVGRKWTEALPLSVAVLGLLAASAARADGYSLRLEPGYTSSRNETTAAGATTEFDVTAFTQRYGLLLDKTLWPLLRVGAGGVLDWTQGTLRSPTLEADTDTKRWSGYARFDAGVPTARASGMYEHREESSRVEARDALMRVPTARLIFDSVSADVRLAPAGIPDADLRLSRTEIHDAARIATDTKTDALQLILRYSPRQEIDLRYTLRAADAEDRIADAETLTLANSLRAASQSSFLQQRLTVYASFDATRIDTRTTVSGIGGSVLTQQFPIRGLSAIEIFPALPDRITCSSTRTSAPARGSTSATRAPRRTTAGPATWACSSRTRSPR
jgi:hypothetical protein